MNTVHTQTRARSLLPVTRHAQAPNALPPAPVSACSRAVHTARRRQHSNYKFGGQAPYRSIVRPYSAGGRRRVMASAGAAVPHYAVEAPLRRYSCTACRPAPCRRPAGAQPNATHPRHAALDLAALPPVSGPTGPPALPATAAATGCPARVVKTHACQARPPILPERGKNDPHGGSQRVGRP